MAATVQVGTYLPAYHAHHHHPASVPLLPYISFGTTPSLHDISNLAASPNMTPPYQAKMNTTPPNTLKRRRPFDHGDSPVEQIYQHQALPRALASAQPSSMSQPDDRYILEEAAKILQVPIPQLLGLGRPQQPQEPQPSPGIIQQAAFTLDVPVASLFELQEQHRHKRHRAAPEMTVQQQPQSTLAPANIGQALEKPLKQEDSAWDLAPTSGPGTFLGLNGSRIADCLSTFASCTPCVYESPDEEHQPIANSTPYDYNGSRLVRVEAPPTPSTFTQSQSPEYHAIATIPRPAHPGYMGCDEPPVIGGYLPQYPSLPPSRPHDTGQPPVGRETMLYPGSAYPRSAQEVHFSMSPINPGPQNMHNGGSYMPAHLNSDTPSPSSSNTDGMMDLAHPYGMFAGYGSSPAFIGDGINAAIDPYHRPHDYDMMFPIQRGPPAKRGPFKDQQDRDETAKTRKMGSCIRCRMQRIRCKLDPADPEGCCITCRKVANANKIWRLPCLRLKINNVVLSKPGQVRGFEWTKRWKDSTVADDISSWASSETRTIRVTEGFTGKSVAVRVRQFIPQEGDSLTRSWVTKQGDKRSVKIPPYALIDMEAAKSSFDSYIRHGVEECLMHLVDSKKQLLWVTYSLALKMARDPKMDRKEQQLLRSALELWVSIRLTTTSFEIVGEDTLGMPHDIMDRTSPLCGKIPLPPVLGAQIDMILIHQIQAKFRHDTLELLQKLTQENKPKSWLTTYLVTFMLLHNIALVIRHDAGYARKHGMDRRFAREDKVKDYYVGATTLLAYCHYRGGSKMFGKDAKDDDVRLHSGEEGAQFVAYTRRYAREHEQEWRDLLQSNGVEDEHYFISQLYEQNWMPREWPV